MSSQAGCGEPGSQLSEGRAGREGSFRMLVGLRVLGALNPRPISEEVLNCGGDSGGFSGKSFYKWGGRGGGALNTRGKRLDP